MKGGSPGAKKTVASPTTKVPRAYDPEQKLLEMEDIARDLNSFTNHPQDRLSEETVLLRSVNTLPSEYEIQIQLIEDKKGPLNERVY